MVLIGPRGGGKTTVGRCVARRLGWTFIDVDEMIQAVTGRTIAELFAESGESAFRSTERQTIDGLHLDGPAVISIGAGAVEDAENRLRVTALGTVVYLQAAPDVCRRRVVGDPASAHLRPLLPAAAGAPEDRETARRPLYEQLAAWRLDTTDLTVEEVCESVIRQLGLQSGSNGR